jgi:hypothetical protein
LKAPVKDHSMSLVGKSIGDGTDEQIPPDLLAKLTVQKVRLAEMAAKKIREDSNRERYGMAASEARKDISGPYSAYSIEKGFSYSLRQFCTIAFGVGASVLVTNAIAPVSRLAGFDLDALSPAIAIPTGALLIGLATALGYRFGCWFFRCKATLLLLIQMAVVAEFYPLVIYSFSHQVMVLNMKYPGFATPNSSRLRNNAISR